MSFSKIVLKTQKIFKSESHNVFTEEIWRLPQIQVMIKKMWSIDLKETYAYGMNKKLICKKETN